VGVNFGNFYKIFLGEIFKKKNIIKLKKKKKKKKEEKKSPNF